MNPLDVKACNWSLVAGRAAARVDWNDPNAKALLECIAARMLETQKALCRPSSEIATAELRGKVQALSSLLDLTTPKTPVTPGNSFEVS